METFHRKFLVHGKDKIKLRQYDPDTHGKVDSAEHSLPDLQKNLDRLTKLQYKLYSENKRSLLIILQGLDTAGKDGVVRHVITAFNPQGCIVTSFKEPTHDELAHDFLWRIHPHAPRRGCVSIFNRSHYEDVLISRVHRKISKSECESRFNMINQFEKMLHDESQTTVLKFFFHISKDEQLNRFKQRLDDPARNWKISESDYTEREYWDKYIKVYEDVLTNTSTDRAPWYIIPSNHKWFRDLVVSEILVHALEQMHLEQPRPTVDLEKIRRKYHEAATGKSKNSQSK